MENVAEKVYMDLVARGKDIETARCWRRWTTKFDGCCGTKTKYDRDDVIRYLSGEGFERYQFSGGWVFPSWIGFSQWFKKEFSDYPKRETLVALSKMGKGEREEDVWFGVYLWEKERLVGKGLRLG